PGCKPPSANSSTVRRWRSPKASSLRTRARWKSASPSSDPATCQSAIPNSTPTPATIQVPRGPRPSRGLNANGRATAPIAAYSASTSQSEPCTANTTALAHAPEQQAAGPLGLASAAVLGEEAQVPAQVLLVQPVSVGAPAHVHDLRAGVEEHLPARPVEAVAPVGLLAEHEEVFVEEPDRVRRVTAHEQARAEEPLHLARLVVGEAGAVESVQRPRPRAELTQEEVLGRQPPERGKAPHRALQRSVLVPEPRPHDGGLGMLVGVRDQLVDRVVHRPRVRVQEQ